MNVSTDNEALRARLDRVLERLDRVLERVDALSSALLPDEKHDCSGEDRPESKPVALPEPPSVRLDEDARETLRAPPVKTTAHRVAGAFSKRFESTLNLAWHYAPHMVSLEDIACWMDKQAQIENVSADKVGKRLLDNFFADAYARKNQFPIKLLAAQCSRFYSPPAVARHDEPDAEVINERRRREQQLEEQRRLTAKLDAIKRNAVAPPPLEDLIDRIGRKI